jgi:hypothetical protein
MKHSPARRDRPSARGGARPLAAAVVGLASLAVPAAAQVRFSIDFKGASHGVGPVPLREGDVLIPFGGQPAFGPHPPPSILLPTSQIGLGVGACPVVLPGFPCTVEVDALSFGDDKHFLPTPNPLLQTRLFYSVGVRTRSVPTTLRPSIFSEANLPQPQVAADVFTAIEIPAPLPVPIPAVPVVNPANNAMVFDGDGLGSSAGSRWRGLGLVEPHLVPSPPAPPTPPYLIGGDDLDALHLGTGGPMGGVFYSLDGTLIDPDTGFPGTNSVQTVSGSVHASDVLFCPIGGVPQLYATAATLGLDQFGPDDLDVLILRENGTPGYQKSLSLYDWLPGTPGARDMLIFSVRKGSAVIGRLDFLQGRPIAPGDLLIPPPTGFGPGLPPGIIVPGETLGLRTARAGSVEEDELDGGGTGELCYDCNGNGIEDAVDIAVGSSADVNGNGVPDECESSYVKACACPSSTPPPCGNDDPNAGCDNSTGVGALLTPVGTTSVSTDDLVLNATQLPNPATGIWLRSDTNAAPAPLKDGLLCLGGTILRFGTGGPGATSKGPGMVAQAGGTSSPMLAGATWHFQYYYRNVIGPCGQGANLTDMVSVTWTP